MGKTAKKKHKLRKAKPTTKDGYVQLCESLDKELMYAKRDMNNLNFGSVQKRLREMHRRVGHALRPSDVIE